MIIRAVLVAYHAATHTADVRPVLGPAAQMAGLAVLASVRPDLMVVDRDVAVLAWSDVSGVVLGPYGVVPPDPPSADNADTVDSIHAAAAAAANKLLALDAASKLPASITGDADTVDSIHAAAAAAANMLLALNAASKLPASITGDADTVDSIHAATTPTASKLLAMNANARFPAHTVAGLLTLLDSLNISGVTKKLYFGSSGPYIMRNAGGDLLLCDGNGLALTLALNHDATFAAQVDFVNVRFTEVSIDLAAIAINTWYSMDEINWSDATHRSHAHLIGIYYPTADHDTGYYTHSAFFKPEISVSAGAGPYVISNEFAGITAIHVSLLPTITYRFYQPSASTCHLQVKFSNVDGLAANGASLRYRRMK